MFALRSAGEPAHDPARGDKAGRLSAVLYVSRAGGVFIEAGTRDTVADLGLLHAGAGLTLRTPLVFSP